MQTKSLSEILTSGVGRRIFGLFLLAGILPVIVTAFLAYLEVGRGHEREVDRQLRDYAKAYGVEVLSRLLDISEKSAEIVRVVESSGSSALADHAYCSTTSLQFPS